MTKLIFFLLILSVVLGNTIKFSLFSPEIHFSFLDLTIIFFNLILGVNFLRHKLFRTYISRSLLLSHLLFSITVIISLIFSIYHFGLSSTIIGSLYYFRWLGYSVAVIFFTKYLHTHQIHKLIVTLGLLSVMIGLIQYFFIPDVRFLALNNWDPHYFRIIGSFLDPGFTGLIYVLTLLTLTLHPLKSSLKNFLGWAFTYLALALTYSRSSYLAFLVSMAYLSIFYKSWRLLLIAALLLFCTIQILPNTSGGEGVFLGRTSTISARIRNWQNSLTIWKSYPFFGVGFNTYRYAQKQFGFLDQSTWLTNHAGAGADSSLLFIAATTGIFGLLAYLNYLRTIFSFSSDSIELKIVIVTLLAHSFFLNSLFYPWVMLWISLLLTAYKPHSAPSRLYSPSGQLTQS